jgi:hypothetical protein
MEVTPERPKYRFGWGFQEQLDYWYSGHTIRYIERPDSPVPPNGPANDITRTGEPCSISLCTIIFS